MYMYMYVYMYMYMYMCINVYVYNVFPNSHSAKFVCIFLWNVLWVFFITVRGFGLIKLHVVNSLQELVHVRVKDAFK